MTDASLLLIPPSTVMGVLAKIIADYGDGELVSIRTGNA